MTPNLPNRMLAGTIIAAMVLMVACRPEDAPSAALVREDSFESGAVSQREEYFLIGTTQAMVRPISISYRGFSFERFTTNADPSAMMDYLRTNVVIETIWPPVVTSNAGRWEIRFTN